MVVREGPACQDRVDEREPRRGAVAHRHRDRPVQRDHRGGIGAYQHVVESHDLGPVRGGRGGGLRVHRRDRGLQRVGADAARGERPLDQGGALRDLIPAPPRAVLVVQQHQLAGRPGARGPPRLVQQHQSQEAHRLGLRQELDQEASQADGLAGEVGAGERLARGGGVALVEHQVDHVEHRVEPVGQLDARRHLVGNARVADLGLGADDALRERGRRGEEGARDLLGGEPADLPQRQRHLSVRAAGRGGNR